MEVFFKQDPTQSFSVFSTMHLLTLLFFGGVLFLIYIFREFFREKRINKVARMSIVVLMLLSEFSLHLWLYWIGAWEVEHSLPLHLSSVSLLLSAYMVATKRYAIFEITYFAGIGSALPNS